MLGYSVSNNKSNFTLHTCGIPDYLLDVVVLAPEALLTAVLVKDPVTGIELTREPIILPKPRAISS